MDRSVKNKIVLVTGGAAGIGFEITDNFLKNGAKVVIVLDIDEEAGKKAEKIFVSKYGDEKSIFMKCDVTKDLEKVYKSIIDKFEHVDVLVNNAGIVNEESVRKTVDVNVVAVIEWSMKFLEHMRVDKGGKGGTIINMSSIAGIQCSSFLPYYTASKHAVMGFTRVLGHVNNFEVYAVRVVAMCPYFTETNLLYRYKPMNPRDLAGWKRIVDSKLYQKAEAVGEAAVEVFMQADSGTAWSIKDSKLEQVP